jgi:DNA repair exonuclease SbcCD nuclease subunit
MSGEERRAEMRAVFSSLMSYVRQSNIDVVLLSGDLFDCEYATSETLELMTRELALCNSFVCISPGNHDPYKEAGLYSSGKFPHNVHIFTQESLQCVRHPSLPVCIYGWAFTDSAHTFSPLAGKGVDDSSIINVVCGHADMESAITSYCPLSESDVALFGADYVALSHIHNMPEVKRLGKTTCAYSGFLMSRSFDERGQGGAWLVEIEKDNESCNVEMKRLCFGSRHHEILCVDVSGAKDAKEGYEKILRASEEKKYGADCYLRIILTGAVCSSFSSKELALRNYGVAYVEIKDNTLPLYDSDFLLSDMTLRGELYRYLLPRLTEGEQKDREVAAQALRVALAAINGADITALDET